MSSKRKEKKIKGTDSTPASPHRNGQFFLHPSEIFQRSKVPSQSIPSEKNSKPPPHQKILSIVGRNESRYLNGIDDNSFMVRGIT